MALVLIGGVALAVFLWVDAEPPAPVEPDADIAALLERLTVSDPATWKATVAELAAVGAPAVVPLTEALRAEHRAIREGAAHALGDIGVSAASAVGQLLETFLQDEDDFVRWKAARALGRIGPAAVDALPALERAGADQRESEIVRATSQRAVELINAKR